jgi:DNA invertase Pin-like site-specific DNA recombinase
MNEHKRAVIYARVATQGLNDDNLSTQIEACRQYATQHGLTVIVDHIIVNSCYSGLTLNRPGLDRV